MIIHRSTFYLILDYALNVAMDTCFKNFKIINRQYKSINQIKVGDKFSNIREIYDAHIGLEYIDCEILNIRHLKNFIEVTFKYHYYIDCWDCFGHFKTDTPTQIFEQLNDLIYLYEKNLGISGHNIVTFSGFELGVPCLNKVKPLIYPYIEPTQVNINHGEGYLQHLIDTNFIQESYRNKILFPIEYQFVE